MAQIEPEDILQALKIIVTPSKSSEGLDSSLQHNMSEVQKYLHTLTLSGKDLTTFFKLMDRIHCIQCSLDDIASCDSQTPRSTESLATSSSPEKVNLRWEYSKCNLKLLLCLKVSIVEALQRYESERNSKAVTNPEHTAPPLSPDALSFGQQKLIKTSLQFIACLGICPCLIAGVGIPVENRSGFGEILSGSGIQRLSVAEREYRMWTCVAVLLECVQLPSLGSIILGRHLSDILAILIQLGFAPKKHAASKNTDQTFAKQELRENTKRKIKLSESAESSSILGNSIKNEVASQPLSGEMLQDTARSRLAELTSQVYQPVLVKELLMLQGGAQRAGQQMTQRKLPPSWLRQTCSHMLSQCLLRPDGVNNVLRAILDNISSSDTADLTWKRCEAAAKILATCPPGVQIEHYFRTVAPQIMKLYESKDQLKSVYFCKIASMSICRMYENQPELTNQYLLNVILASFYKCLHDVPLEDVSEPVVYVSESELQESVQCIHKMVVLGSEPGGGVVKFLEPVLHVIFHLYVFCRAGVASLRKPTEEILVSYLKSVDVHTALVTVQCFLARDSSGTKIKCMNDRIIFVPGQDGGVATLLTPHDRPMLLDESWEGVSTSIVELLKQVDVTGLSGQFFLYCLQDLTEIVCREVESDPDLIDPDTVESLTHKLCVLGVLSNMADTLSYTCLIGNTQHIITFVKATLERCVKVLDHSEDAVLGMFESDTVTMAMGLLAAVIQGETKVDVADYESAEELLPLLQRIVDSHPDMFIQHLATQLRVIIATHGCIQPDLTVTPDDLKSNQNIAQSACQMDKKQPVTASPKIEVLSSTDSENSGHVRKSDQIIAEKFNDLTFGEKEGACPRTEYVEGSSFEGDAGNTLQEAMKDIEDTMIPVKAHGLISLRRLVESKDTETMLKHEQILEIFKQHLSHQDSYIYLAAIQGLASLSLVNTDHVINVLVQEYGKHSRSAELRMKIGEVLVKTSRSLGEMAPKYRDTLVRCCLNGAKDDDHHIRASSVSNMAEICYLLRYSLGHNIQEILECVGALVRTDHEAVVRRAAAMFIHKLLSGLGNDVLQILSDSMKVLYRLLKMTLTSEKDEIVCVHCQLALEILDDVMKDFLFPKQRLEKKIHVISAPSMSDFT